jgi:diguanylate cyclase (GGDEF)-like protein
MDVDDFKPINDQYGHGVGDQTLIRVVEHLEACVRKSDLLARWGGDEFMVVLPKSSLDEAKELAERIRHKIKEAAPVGALNLTLSLGVVERRMDESPAALMAQGRSSLVPIQGGGQGWGVGIVAAPSKVE